MSKRLPEELRQKTYQSIIPIAIEARNSFISEDEVIKDSFKLIEQLGFLLLRFPALEETEELSGFYIKKGDRNCIYINTLISLGRQNLSVWHEYYHYYTEDGNGLSYTSNSEWDLSEFKANVFAGCILMPENLIRRYLEHYNITLPYITNIQLVKMQAFFKVSLAALITRLCVMFPECEKVLSRRYWLTKNTDNAKKKLYDLIHEAHGDINLVQPTRDVYIPDFFFDDIEFNVKNQRMSLERAKKLLEMIDSLGKNV